MSDPIDKLPNLHVERRVQEIRDQQLAGRAALGAVVYPLVFAMIAFGTGVHLHQPAFVWSTFVVFLLLAAGRIAICSSFSRLYPKNPLAWRSAFISITSSLGLAWGLLAAYFMLMAPWTAPTLLVLFSGSGFAGGTIATMSIDRTAYRVYLLGILVPPGLTSILSEQQYGTILGSFHLLYFLFLWIQGKQISTAYAIWARNSVEIVVQRDQLAHAKKSAEDASMAKSRLMANVSHELRTPMNVIIGTTEWALSRPDIEAERPLWEEIENAGLQLLTVINQVLDFSKIDSGIISKPQSEPFVPIQVLNQVHQLFKRRASQQGLEFRLKTEIPNELVLLGDAGRIKQILCNLVGNALKFTSDGRVEMRAEWKNDRFCFEVKDTGPGILSEHHQLIFDPFTQADGGTARKHGGAGLGLSISRELVESMGGTIQLQSEPGNGAVFCVELPAPEAPTAIKKELTNSFFERNYLVLVVDDDPTNLRVAHRQLTHLGMRVEEARTGDEALEKCREEKFDLILMDLQMPHTDGFSITAQIKQSKEGLNRQTPIVAFSAHTGEAEQSRCREAGMVAFLSKPLQRQILIKKLEALEQRGLL
ncbi:MAG: ATP-binding protein [Vulcanimicrobiota bacterium]